MENRNRQVKETRSCSLPFKEKEETAMDDDNQELLPQHVEIRISGNLRGIDTDAIIGTMEASKPVFGDTEVITSGRPILDMSEDKSDIEISQFDMDLADAMVNGLDGYDPRNNVGEQVIMEVLGVKR